ncbi:MAG: hypothetical protein Q8L29_02610 [archaeon]|nr:hypothetical protein [archaeon]
MNVKYEGFQDLPLNIARDLDKRIREKKSIPQIPADISVQEQIQIVQEHVKNPSYTKAELEQIADAFILLNNAVGHGLPNQLYKMIMGRLDVDLASGAFLEHAIKYYDIGEVQKLADYLIASIIDQRG